MLPSFLRVLSRKQKKPTRRSRGVSRLVRGRYDAAQQSPNSARHWQQADGLSANAANSPGVRRILRNRSRYECANNSYADGIVQTLANDVIGTGPRLQMLGLSADDNHLIERLFTEWAVSSNLADHLQCMRQARSTDGESFALFIDNPVLQTPVKLDLRLIEADHISTPGLAGHASDIDGIEFDRFGNPSHYHVLKNHPGDHHIGPNLDFDRVPAENVLHDFRAKRPGQVRGIPEITAALPLFAMLRDYSLATLDAAKAAAYFAGVVFTDAPANGEADDIEPMDLISLERNMLLTMPGGWKIGQVKSEHPSASYAEFKREVLNEIARCLNMPFNVAAGNSSGYNFASGRLDHQTYFKSINVDRAHLERRILDRIFHKWLQEAMLIEDFLPQRLRNVSVDFRHQWFWDGTEHVDPVKEASAQKTRLENNTTTLADEYARKGQDWEAQLEQRAKEKAKMDELGLTTAESLPEAAEQSDEDDGGDEGEEENSEETAPESEAREETNA